MNRAVLDPRGARWVASGTERANVGAPARLPLSLQIMDDNAP